MVEEIVGKNHTRDRDEENINCLVCLSKFPVNTKVFETNREEKVEILSELFKVLCKWMRWEPSAKYFLYFNEEEFPFCADCRSSIVEVYNLDSMLADLKKQMHMVILKLSAKILESENILMKIRPSQLSDSNYHGSDCEKAIDIRKSEISEKIYFYRKCIYDRYSTSVRLITDPNLRRPSGNVCSSEDGHTNEELPSVVGSDAPQMTSVGEELQETGLPNSNNLDADQGPSGFIQSKRKRKAIQSGEMNCSLEEQESDVFIDDTEDSGSEYEPSIASENTDSSYNLSNEGEKESYENFHHNDIPASSQVLTSVKKAKSQCREDTAIKTINENEDLLNEVTPGYDGREPFSLYKDRIRKVENGLNLFAERSLFRCGVTSMKCVTCNLAYRSKQRLLTHLRDICPGGPPNDVVKSFRSHHFFYDRLKSGEYQCRHCKHSSSNDAEMVLHVKNCHNGRSFTKEKPYYAEVGPNKYVCNHKYLFEFVNDQYKCGNCSGEFSSLVETVTHIHKGHTLPAYSSKGERPKKVQFKESCTPGKFTFNGEVVFEKFDDNFQCGQCVYYSSKLELMKRHFKSKHFDRDRFSCNQCAKGFFRKDHLNRHKEIHLNSRSLVCEICGKSFKLIQGLQLHKRLLHPETASKQFSCSICNRSFGLQSMLKVHHARKHERMACDVCGKVVPRDTLNSHMVTHGAESKYKCKKCNKYFRYNNSLYTHMKSHDGRKPYNCDICGMKFTQSYSVTRHKLVVHNSNKVNKTCKKAKKRKKSRASSEEEETQTSEEENSNNEED